MQRLFAPLTVLLLVGCKPPNNISGGDIVLYQHFPFDGTRTWEYQSSDTEVSYKLVGTMRADDPDPEASEDFSIYHIDFTTDCVQPDPDCVEGELVRTIGFSSDISNGVLVHTFQQGANIDITYDPPLVVTPKGTNVGDVTETVTDGVTWSSELLGFEPCDGVIQMVDDEFAKSNCSAHILLTDGDTFPDTNYGLAGDLWVAKGLGIIGIGLEGDDAVWGLSKMNCEPLEDCDGSW